MVHAVPLKPSQTEKDIEELVNTIFADKLANSTDGKRYVLCSANKYNYTQVKKSNHRRTSRGAGGAAAPPPDSVNQPFFGQYIKVFRAET